MLSESGTLVGDPARPVRGGDIAILLRRFTYLDVFRRALVGRGIPFVVVQGRGFYGAQEVMDLAQLLRIIDEPQDTLAWAAALRSPLVGLTDAGMLRVAHQGSLASLARRDWEPPVGLEPFEIEAVGRFRALVHRLGRDADRLRPSGCLQEAIDALDLRAVLAAGFQGEQAVANIDKLVEWARARESRGLTSAGTLGRELLVLADTEPREAQAPSLEEGDPRAVRLMTIHQSKGLEFPVVFIPECGALDRSDNDVALYDRELGLSVRPRDPVGELIATPRSHRIGKRLRDRAAAESSRLFYVALTRARDHLVLSGETDSASTWRNHLDRFITEDPAAEGLLWRRELSAPPPVGRLRPAIAPAVDAGINDRAEAVVQSALRPMPPRVSRLVLTVTQASDLDLCPRRYLLAHEVGLAEHPRLLVGRDEGPTAGGLDAAARGTLAHALLERADWVQVQQGDGSSLERVLKEEGQPLTPAAREILSDVEHFLQGSLARELAQTPANRIWRELPFVLSLPDAHGCSLGLKGQIDLVALVEPGVALVLDYKSGSSRGHGPEAYAFQLQCYALAAAQLLGEGVEIRTGLVFLKDRTAKAEMRLTPRRDVGERLQGLPQKILAARAAGQWEGLELEQCRAAGCGFAYRCHPAAYAASMKVQLKLPI
jgi:ATP-dependent exoDNAse (exonuclease V) beta subunit